MAKTSVTAIFFFDSGETWKYRNVTNVFSLFWRVQDNNRKANITAVNLYSTITREFIQQLKNINDAKQFKLSYQ